MGTSVNDHSGTDYHFEDMQVLSEMLEAEASGRPFDRARARQLAQFLGGNHPEIGKTMMLMCERMKAGDARA